MQDERPPDPIVTPEIPDDNSSLASLPLWPLIKALALKFPILKFLKWVLGLVPFILQLVFDYVMRAKVLSNKYKGPGVLFKPSAFLVLLIFKFDEGEIVEVLADVDDLVSNVGRKSLEADRYCPWWTFLCVWHFAIKLQKMKRKNQKRRS